MRVWITCLAGLVACKGGGDGGSDPVDGTDPTAPTPTDTQAPIVRAGCEVPLPMEPIVALYEAGIVDVDGARYSWWAPQSPIATVYVFHGSGGDIGTVNNPEWWQLYNQLYCEGIAVGITESATQDWDTSTRPDNDGFRRQEVLRGLMDTAGVPADLPAFGVGFSNGGQFLTAWGELAANAGWDVRGGAYHNSSGGGGTIEVPANYHISVNDESADPDAITAAHESHQRQGVAGELYIAEEVAVTPTTFLLLDGFDAQDAQFVYDDLLAEGMIDAAGARLIPVDDIIKTLNRWQDNTEAPGAARVTNQLRSMWATHRYNAQHSAADVALFLEQL